jgi:hypothetical protein
MATKIKAWWSGLSWWSARTERDPDDVVRPREVAVACRCGNFGKEPGDRGGIAAGRRQGEQRLSQPALGVVTVGTRRFDVDLLVRGLIVEERRIQDGQPGHAELQHQGQATEPPGDAPHAAHVAFAALGARRAGPSTGIRNQKVLPLP